MICSIIANFQARKVPSLTEMQGRYSWKKVERERGEYSVAET